jgi:hypothetical protein
MGGLLKGSKSFFMLGDIVDLFEFLLLLGVFFLKELLFELLDVLLNLLEHPSDLKLIIGKVVYEHSLISCNLLDGLLFLLIAILLLIISNCSLTILDKVLIVIMMPWCSLASRQ